MSADPNSDMPPPPRGLFILPNLFTTAALFCGFFAMVSAIQLKFDQAAFAIFLATIFDGLDGRVARMTRTQSKFGQEYDSLADLVSFGVAPAILGFVWAADVSPVIRSLPISWLVTFLFVACAALRLARFNAQIGKVSSEHFVGLPSPTAAVLVSALIWCADSYDILSHKFMAIPVLVTTTICALLMVSTIPFFSGKLDSKPKRNHDRLPIMMVLFVVMMFILVAIEPPLVLFAGPAIYVLLSLIHWWMHRHPEDLGGFDIDLPLAGKGNSKTSAATTEQAPAPKPTDEDNKT